MYLLHDGNRVPREKAQKHVYKASWSFVSELTHHQFLPHSNGKSSHKAKADLKDGEIDCLLIKWTTNSHCKGLVRTIFAINLLLNYFSYLLIYSQAPPPPISWLMTTIHYYLLWFWMDLYEKFSVGVSKVVTVRWWLGLEWLMLMTVIFF